MKRQAKESQSKARQQGHQRQASALQGRHQHEDIKEDGCQQEDGRLFHVVSRLRSLQTINNKVFHIEGRRQIARTGEAIGANNLPALHGVFNGELFTTGSDYYAAISDVAFHAGELG